MKKLKSTILLCAALIGVATPLQTLGKPSLNAAPSESELDLFQVLKEADAASPRLKSARYANEAGTQNVEVNKAAFLPEIDAAAAASTGLPGSMAMVGIDNNIGASQRVGFGAALIVRQNIWDFGRTSEAVKTAEAQSSLSKSQLALAKMDIEREVLQTYLNCAFLKSRLENSKFLLDQSRVLARETDRFVSSGQRSVIERYLVDAEAKEAETRNAEFRERVLVIEGRLAIELGRPETDRVVCADLSNMGAVMAKLEATKSTSPILMVQEQKIQVAEGLLGRAKAESRPRLIAIATGGYFDNQTLKDKFNYSAGIGITVPLFSGFRVESQVGREIASLNAETASLGYSRQVVEQTNSRYEEQVRSLTVRLNFLREENKLAKQVFDLARKRYLSLQGNMIDLREAIRNMDRVLRSTDETNHDLFLARGERSLFNGASPDQ